MGINTPLFNWKFFALKRGKALKLGFPREKLIPQKGEINQPGKKISTQGKRPGPLNPPGKKGEQFRLNFTP